MILGYIGPETILPLGSALAAIGGAILIGWRWIAMFFVKAYRFVVRRPPAELPQHTEPGT